MKLPPWVLFGLTGAALLLGGRVWAGGIPAEDPLEYSGVLEDGQGKPLTGEHDIELRVWHDEPRDTPDCSIRVRPKLSDGRFAIVLPHACRSAIAQHPETYVELLVDEATLGREKIRAVPYAIEADHASKADVASSAAGDLRKALDEVKDDLSALKNATTPAKTVDRFNAGVEEGAEVTLGKVTSPLAHDIRWALQHAAASGACAATSPPDKWNSYENNVVLPKPRDLNCDSACATYAPSYPRCQTSIAVGHISLTQAKAYSDVVAKNFRYLCSDSQPLDEVLAEALTTEYTAYCCCYVPIPM